MKKFMLFIMMIIIFGYSNIIAKPNIKDSDRWKTHQYCDKIYYEFCYVEELEQPEWVYYNLTAEETIDNVKRKDCFKSDPEIITGSATNDDYLNSGYDKGHLANCDDFRFNQEAMESTFLLSNMSPQLPEFNRRGAWRESEKYGEELALKFGYIDIITGPIILNKSELKYIGTKNKVVIPDGYYKIFYNAENNFIECYVIWQNDCAKKLKEYKTNIGYIETMTGLIFDLK